MRQLFDVVAINVVTGTRRSLALDKALDDAEAIIKMAVLRRGVNEEFYLAIPAEERKLGEGVTFK